MTAAKVHFTKIKHMALPFASYFLILLALYAPDLVAGRGAFNIGGWHVVYVANYLQQQVQDFFGAGETGQAFFPAGHPLAYGEPLPLAALILLAFKFILGGSDFWAVHALIFLLQSIAALGVNLLTARFVRAQSICWLSGFFYAFNNYYFSTIDDFICISYCALPFVFIYLLRYLESNRSKHLITAAVIGGLQIYQSVYVYVFQTIFVGLIGLLAIFFYKNRRQLLIQGLAVFAILTFFVALPEFVYLLRNLFVYAPVDPGRPAGIVTQVTGLRLYDFFRFLPETLLYPSVDWLDLPPNPWAAARRHAGVGLVLPICALGSLALINIRDRIILSLGIFIAMLVAMGPQLHFPSATIDSPLFAFYNDIPILRFMRVPSRAYFVAIMAMAVISAFSVQQLMARICGGEKRRSIAIVVCLALIFAIENLPFPPRTFAIKQHFENWPGARSGFDLPVSAVVLNLPSNLMWNVMDADTDVPGYGREFIYMYQQIKLGVNTVNGASGYLPKERLRLEPAIKNFPSLWAVQELRAVGVTHVIFHKKLVASGEASLLATLNVSGALSRLAEDNNYVLFLIKPAQS